MSKRNAQDALRNWDSRSGIYLGFVAATQYVSEALVHSILEEQDEAAAALRSLLEHFQARCNELREDAKSYQAEAKEIEDRIK